MKKLILIIGIGVVSMFSATSQNDVDAMRYSQLTFGGTARFASMAGSMGALGGDISCLSFNPAGIAVFRKTEFTITPSFFSQSTFSTFNSTSSSGRKLNFNLGNIGMVATIHLKEDKSGGWESLNFGFGYNRTNNFHNEVSIKGTNNSSSLLDAYVIDAAGKAPSDFDLFSTNLAYQTYLINPTTIPNQYSHVIPNYGELQQKTVSTTGSMGETDISFGGNYKSKLFVGGTVGIVNARYEESSKYTETNGQNDNPDFNSFDLTNKLTTTGHGVNFKLGFIVKPIDWLNVGLAIHSPTQLKLHDRYSSEMYSSVDTSNTPATFDQKSPDGSFDYHIITPWRAMSSVGFIIKKVAVINVEYEYLDYSYAQLNSSPQVFTDVNSLIRTKYTSTGNFRAGAEYRFDPFAVRVGYALYGSPFKNGENANANRTSFSGGVGYRQGKFFIDLAYVYTLYTEYNYLYDSPNLTSVKSNYTNASFMMTLGVRL